MVFLIGRLVKQTDPKAEALVRRRWWGTETRSVQCFQCCDPPMWKSQQVPLWRYSHAAWNLNSMPLTRFDKQPCPHPKDRGEALSFCTMIISASKTCQLSFPTRSAHTSPLCVMHPAPTPECLYFPVFFSLSTFPHHHHSWGHRGSSVSGSHHPSHSPPRTFPCWGQT